MAESSPIVRAVIFQEGQVISAVYMVMEGLLFKVRPSNNMFLERNYCIIYYGAIVFCVSDDDNNNIALELRHHRLIKSLFRNYISSLDALKNRMPVSKKIHKQYTIYMIAKYLHYFTIQR